MQSSILTLETTKYSIKIENFEGPLEMLCHLLDEFLYETQQIRGL